MVRFTEQKNQSNIWGLWLTQVSSWCVLSERYWWTERCWSLRVWLHFVCKCSRFTLLQSLAMICSCCNAPLCIARCLFPPKFGVYPPYTGVKDACFVSYNEQWTFRTLGNMSDLQGSHPFCNSRLRLFIDQELVSLPWVTLVLMGCYLGTSCRPFRLLLERKANGRRNFSY